MAKPALFVGVDGGATKTSVRVENDRGRLMGEARSGPATLQLPVERIWQSIHEALAAVSHSQLKVWTAVGA
jgi:N-acetylglucosamine kinase-like BadF-type ATPase